MGKRPDKGPKPKDIALEFKELLLANGYVSSTPGPTGQMLVGFYEKDRGTFFVPCNPAERDTLFNLGFIMTAVRHIMGPRSFMIPVHGRIQIIGTGTGCSGDTEFEALENLLRCRVNWPDKDAGTVNGSGTSQPDPTGDVQDADASTASG